MKTSTPDKKWFDDLVVELRLRQVDGVAIGDTVASARELIDDTGEGAEDIFGSARDYAASLELPRDPRSMWRGPVLWPLVAGLVAFLTYMQALVPWATSEPLLVSPAQCALLGVAAVFIALLPLYFKAAIRRPWLLGLIFVLGAAAGFFSSVVAPATADQAWLTLAAEPWLVGSTVAMVLISLGTTIRTLRRGNADDIIDPLRGAAHARRPSGLMLALVTDWMFPVFSALMFALVVAFPR